MKKSLFLEFKPDPADLDVLRSVNFNDLIVSFDPLRSNGQFESFWSGLKKLGRDLSLSINSFDLGGCPADPRALGKLFRRIEKGLNLEPRVLWLDHFRFDGRWEESQGKVISETHLACPFCTNLNRSQFLFDTAEKIMTFVNRQASVGYFAVPFKADETASLGEDLGQSHFLLRQIFDLVSPMLYHRMIKKPATYISEYVRYLERQSNKPILPIVQVKDMPDDRPDELTKEEITREFSEAVKPPSMGVAFFSWDQAVEKGKTEVIRELFAK